VNGVLSCQKRAPSGKHFHLDNTRPLIIGNGVQGAFQGAIADLRIYREALDERALSAVRESVGSL
jgi:hypothetical protein